MKKTILLALIACLFSCQNQTLIFNPENLTDNDLVTFHASANGDGIVFPVPFEGAVLSYSLYSSGEDAAYDPTDWTLKGSNDGNIWTIVDERKGQSFCSRFQEVVCVVQNPSSYSQYMLEAVVAKGDTVKIAEVILSDKNMLEGWENFKYPEINFKVEDPDTEGARIYGELVQNPDEYVKYHARKVAEILYYTAQDTMVNVEQIDYTLKEYDGISAKGGSSPRVYIVYSTKHIENSAQESLFKLNFETRGVLYHELVHAYQFEPNGCGSYSTNRVFWACIEGIADAVRAEAGYFDMSTRRPGGNWMDGYRTTGFFLQWLNTKDTNALRKFHLTVRDLEVWSFDEAIKIVFGKDASIDGMWNEYQEFLLSQQ